MPAPVSAAPPVPDGDDADGVVAVSTVLVCTVVSVVGVELAWSALLMVGIVGCGVERGAT